MEIWKDVERYEGLYQISDLGRVKSLKRYERREERILKEGSAHGYCTVHLSKNGKVKSFRVHRLVAAAFIPNPNNLPEVNHKDENKENNHVDNLEWCDRNYNANYGTAINRRVKNLDYAKKVTTMDYSKKVKNTDYEAISRKIRKAIIGTNLKTGEMIEFESMTEAKENGFNDSHISSVCKGKRKQHKGFKWEYKN